MNTKIAVALIGGGTTIAAALIAGVFGLFGEHQKSPRQGTTHGAQSPVVISQGGVNINYGVPQVIVDGWQRSLTDQGLAQHVVVERLRELADEQKQLTTTLQQRSSADPVSRDALRKVSAGNFGHAADVLIRDLTHRIERKDFTAAADRAEEMSRLRKLQLEPIQAQSYRDMVANLRRKARETVSPPSTSPSSTEDSAVPRNPTSTRVHPGVILTQPAASHPPLAVAIQRPAESESVGFQHEVSGSVSDRRAKVWLVVQPVDTPDCWVQRPGTVNADGTWRLLAYFSKGSRTWGREFQMRALANPKLALKEGRVDCWPEAEASSDSVSVVRR